MIAGFNGMYEVGNCGGVRSYRKPSGRGLFIRAIAREMKPSLANGYPFVNLYCTGAKKPKKFYVHSLVLTAFVGPRPKGKECGHLDGKRTHCGLKNLAWITHKENVGHTLEHGTRNQGEKQGSSKLNAAKVIRMRKQFHGGATQSELKKEFGVCFAQVHRIVHGQQWKHIPTVPA